MIRRSVGFRQIEKDLSLCFCVTVEQDLFSAAAQGLAEHDRMLAALPVPVIVEERAVRDWNIGIVFLDPAAQFRDEPLRLFNLLPMGKCSNKGFFNGDTT